MSPEATDDVKTPAWLKKRKRAKSGPRNGERPKGTAVNVPVIASHGGGLRAVKPCRLPKPKKPFRLIAPRAKTTRYFHVRFTCLAKPVQKSAGTQIKQSAREFAWLWLREHAAAEYALHCRLHGDPLAVSITPPRKIRPRRWN